MNEPIEQTQSPSVELNRRDIAPLVTRSDIPLEDPTPQIKERTLQALGMTSATGDIIADLRGDVIVQKESVSTNPH